MTSIELSLTVFVCSDTNTIGVKLTLFSYVHEQGARSLNGHCPLPQRHRGEKYLHWTDLRPFSTALNMQTPCQVIYQHCYAKERWIESLRFVPLKCRLALSLTFSLSAVFVLDHHLWVIKGKQRQWQIHTLISRMLHVRLCLSMLDELENNTGWFMYKQVAMNVGFWDKYHLKKKKDSSIICL